LLEKPALQREFTYYNFFSKSLLGGAIMDKEIIKSLRNRSFITGKQKTWISELSNAQLLTVFNKIKNGETNMAIARYVKEKLGVMSKSSTRSVSQAISKFKKRLGDISLYLTPTEIKEMGGLEGLKVARKTLMESIQHKGPGNVNLAKESKVLLEITSEIGRLEKKLQEQSDPKNFGKIAHEIMKSFDKEHTNKWVEAVLLEAERKSNVTYGVQIFYTPPDLALFNRGRTMVSNACEKLLNSMKNEPERFDIKKIDKDGNLRKLTKEDCTKMKLDANKKNDTKIEVMMMPRFKM
jgi:hypothetical protein